MVAERARFVRGLTLQVNREPREKQGECVGCIVARVRDQREAVRADAGDELDHYERGCGGQRPCEDTPRSGPVRVRMQSALLSVL